VWSQQSCRSSIARQHSTSDVALYDRPDVSGTEPALGDVVGQHRLTCISTRMSYLGQKVMNLGHAGSMLPCRIEQHRCQRAITVPPGQASSSCQAGFPRGQENTEAESRRSSARAVANYGVVPTTSFASNVEGLPAWPASLLAEGPHWLKRGLVSPIRLNAYSSRCRAAHDETKPQCGGLVIDLRIRGVCWS
jgi:hypothetical protein